MNGMWEYVDARNWMWLACGWMMVGVWVVVGVINKLMDGCGYSFNVGEWIAMASMWVGSGSG